MVQDRDGLVNIIVHGALLVSLALQAVLCALSLFLRLAFSCSVSLALVCATWLLTCSLRFNTSNASNALFACFSNFLVFTETLCVHLNTTTYPQTQHHFRIFTAMIHFGQILPGIMKIDFKSDC